MKKRKIIHNGTRIKDDRSMKILGQLLKISILVAIIAIGSVCVAQAFNPQPEPPGCTSVDITNSQTARMRALYTDANPGTGLDSAMTFFTREAGTLAERMRINDGNVGIGTTSPSYKLHVNGTAFATGAAGKLSDYRYKKNINDILFDALELVKELRPVTFEWKEPQDSGMEGTQLGFIAQEVQEVLPEAVLTQDNEEQTKGLKYDAFIPLLTKAIQELKVQNEALKAENNSLRHEIEQIKEAIGL